MAAGGLWLAVKVVCGAKLEFGSKIVSCSSAESFGQLLLRLEGGWFAERQVNARGWYTQA